PTDEAAWLVFSEGSVGSPSAGGRRGATADSRTDDRPGAFLPFQAALFRPLVVPQALEARGPQLATASPFAEGPLADQLRLHPVQRLARADRVCEGAAGAMERPQKA